MMRTAWDDVRSAGRRLRRSRGSTIASVLLMALGIGGATAMFTVVDSLILHPLPFKDADRIMFVVGAITPRDGDMLNFWQQNDVLAPLAIFAPGGMNLADGLRSVRLNVTAVSPKFFELLEVEPALGRAFNISQAEPEASHLALLSDGLWRQNFGAATDVIGRSVTLNGTPYQVVGVMPAGFHFPEQTQMWIPWVPHDPALDVKSSAGAVLLPQSIIGRLRPGISPPEAQARMRVLENRLEASESRGGGENAHSTLTVIPLAERLGRNFRGSLFLLLVAMACLLLVACANVANMMLIRGVGRRKEIAVRIALGADRFSLFRGVLAEAMLLALLGGASGVLLCLAGLRVIHAVFLVGFPNAGDITLSFTTLVFAAAAILAAGIVTGVAPALQWRNSDLPEALQQGDARSAPKGSYEHRLRGSMVVLEVAAAMILLVLGGLMLRSVARLTSVNPGFDPHKVVTLQLALPKLSYPTLVELGSFHTALLEKLRRNPDLRASGVVSRLPLGTTPGGWWVERNALEPEAGTLADESAVDGNYFGAMRIPLIAGRSFTGADSPDAPKVAIVSRSLALKLWAGRNPVGDHLHIGGEEFTRHVVGIVGDVRASSLDQSDLLQLYLPYLQPRFDPDLDMTVVARASSSTDGAMRSLRDAVHAVAPDLPPFDVQTMDSVAANSIGLFRYRAVIAGSFALVAWLLAAVGVYSTVSHSTIVRTREIGVRICLGATRRDTLTLILAEGGRLAFSGVLLGLLAALWLAHTVSSLLFGVAPLDPASFAGAGLLLLLVALIACAIPAWRATRVDPAVALRHE